MKLFEKSLQAVKTLDSVLTTANETFRTEQKKLLDTLKDPTKQIGEMRKVLEETESEQKRIFKETVQEDFASVRKMINEVVVEELPIGFTAVLEAISIGGKEALSEYESEMYIEKYKGNYLALKTLLDKLHHMSKALDKIIMRPDALMVRIDRMEKVLLNWGQDYEGQSSISTALIQSDVEFTEKLPADIQKFVEHNFMMEAEVEGEHILKVKQDETTEAQRAMSEGIAKEMENGKNM